MAQTETQGIRSLFGRLVARFATGLAAVIGRDLHALAPHLPGRVRRVLQLDGDVYEEIAQDRHGIPQALALVIATSLLAGVGQGAPVLIFLGVAWSLLAWLMAAALIWGVATIGLARPVDYPRLLVVLGYGYIWTGLLLFARLPASLGALASVAALGLCFVAFVQATERLLEVSRETALGICGVALLLPFVLLLVALV